MAHDPRPDADDFTRKASEPRVGLMRELVAFMAENKKWWLAPILISILVLGALVMLGGTAAAPFIYPLF
jgi:hypothetical protein